MDYKGGRTKQEIIDWVNNLSFPISTRAYCDELMVWTAKDPLALIYFGKFEGELYDQFIENALKPELYIYNFYHTSDTICATDYGVKAPGISLTR